jgi:hypothetical protein
VLDRPLEVVALAEDLARQRQDARDAIDAAAILSELLGREPPVALPDRPGAQRRAFELLIEAERRGWPDGYALNAERFAPLANVEGFAALRARRNG